MKAFTQTETNNLLTLAQEKIKLGAPLTEVFEEFSKKTGKAKGSVRNHYYKTVKENYKALGLPKYMLPTKAVEFTRAEEFELLKYVIKSVEQGSSVRKSVLNLANGNEKLALRYLNKYRALVKSHAPVIYRAKEEVEREFGYKINAFTKGSEPQVRFKKLEREINLMLDRLLKEVVEENAVLKKKSAELTLENERLKTIVKENMRQKSFTKDYFASLLEKDAR
ncbi:MAG: hypothetical protein IKL82_06560 [Clostridia bacterium]|nr:hypothetical protein [Clostridia bacterium]